uniref:Uncharacterized protein n=1 Tax=Gibberella zeae TaxID=5518 RepID=A0A4E9EJW6_GIBZA
MYCQPCTGWKYL